KRKVRKSSARADHVFISNKHLRQEKTATLPTASIPRFKSAGAQAEARKESVRGAAASSARVFQICSSRPLNQSGISTQPISSSYREIEWYAGNAVKASASGERSGAAERVSAARAPLIATTGRLARFCRRSGGRSLLCGTLIDRAAGLLRLFRCTTALRRRPVRACGSSPPGAGSTFLVHAGRRRGFSTRSRLMTTVSCSSVAVPRLRHQSRLAG